jgi:hypothetical protein
MKMRKCRLPSCDNLTYGIYCKKHGIFSEKRRKKGRITTPDYIRKGGIKE